MWQERCQVLEAVFAQQPRRHGPSMLCADDSCVKSQDKQSVANDVYSKVSAHLTLESYGVILWWNCVVDYFATLLIMVTTHSTTSLFTFP